MDSSEVIYRALARALYLALGLFLLLWFIHTVQLVAMFFLLAVILFMGGNPVVTWAEKRGLPRHLGTLALFIIALTAVVVLILLVAPPISKQVQQLAINFPAYEDSLRSWARQTLAPYPTLQSLFGPANARNPEVLQHVGTVLTQLGRYTLTTFEGIVILFIMSVLVLYMLANPRPLVRSYLLIFPEHLRLQAARAAARSSTMVVGWLRSNLIVGAIDGIAAGIFLSLMGVPAALVWAVLAFFGEMVPTVGPFVMTIPPALVALAVSPATGLWVILFYYLMQRMTSDVLAPKVRAAQMRLHPVSIILGILAMTSAFGLLGAFIATPLVAIVKAYYEEFHHAAGKTNGGLDRTVDEILTRELPQRA